MSDEVTVVYDERSSRNWSPDWQINEIYLRTMQNWMQDRLRMRGHLFLNEIFDELELPRTTYGQLNGWLFVEEVPELWTEEPGENGAIILRFTVEGDIHDKIEGKA